MSNDPFAQFAVEDSFSEFEVPPSPSREEVLKDFTNTEDDVAKGGARDTFEARQGHIAGYIASDGSTSFDDAFDNAEHHGRELIGNPKADINETFQTIASETDIGDHEQAIQDILNATEWVTTGDGAVPLDTLGADEEQRISLREGELEAPRARAMESAARAIVPEWAQGRLGIPEAQPSITKMDVTQDVIGSVVGELTAFFTGMKLLKGAGGVRAIPKVGAGLQTLAKTSPRAAMMTEQALSAFTVIGTKSQFHSSSTDLKERAKMLGVDAVVSAAFPVAGELAASAKLGKAALPTALTAMFGAGTVGEDTIEGKLIGGTSLMMMWGITHGMSFRQSRKVAIDVAKASGQKNPEEWVNGLKRADIMRGARMIEEKLYMNSLMRSSASGAKAKAEAGQRLLPSDRIAMAKANEGAVVAKAQAGEIAPIKADRAVLQSKAVLKGVVEGKFDDDMPDFSEAERRDVLEGKSPVRETRGGKERFHGTSSKIASIEEYVYSPDNIFGQGMYTTDAADVSIGYTGKGRGAERTVYSVTENRDDINMYSMEEPLVPDVQNAVDIALKDTPFEGLTETYEGEPITNLRELYNEMRASSAGEGWSKDEVQELFDSISFNLQGLGYDGLEHIGAINSKRYAPHNVKIYFNPKKDLSIEEVDPLTLREQTAKETIEEPLPPEQIQEQGEIKLLQDAQMFNMAEEQMFTQLAQVPSNEPDTEAFELMRLGEQLPALQPQEDLTTPAGNAFLEDVAHRVQRTAEGVAGYFRRFGRQYVSNPELAKRFEDAFHELGAAPVLAVLDVHKALNRFPRTAKTDRAQMSYAIEKGTPVDLPLRLRPVYHQVEQMMADLERMQIDADVLKQSFEESHAERIADITLKIEKASGKKKQQLIEERNRLQEIKAYMPHNIVARRVLEEKLNHKNVGVRRSTQKKLTQFHKTRKGTHSLKEYVEAGIIDENDADVVKLLMSSYADGYHKIAMRGLIEWGKANGEIVPINQEVVNPEEWNAEAELHPVARVGGMKGMKMSRLFAQGLEEMSGADQPQLGNVARGIQKALGAWKVGQFVRPDVIWKHNISQSVLGGSAVPNPVKLAKFTKQALGSVKAKDSLWRELEENGLYQKTDIPTRRTVDQLISQYSNKTKLYNSNEFLSKLANTTSQIFGVTPEEMAKTIKDKNVAKALNDAVMSLPNMVGGATFAGDEVQRTISAISLMDKGYSAKEAAQEAARIHGAYSNVGLGYKNQMRWLAFVHSFRILMPWEYQIKPWITLAKEGYRKAKGEEMDDKKAKSAAWKIFATTLIPAAMDAYMKLNGWDIDEKERESGFRKAIDKITPKIPIGDGKTIDIAPALFPHWRYTKDIETPDGPKQMIWVFGTPNMTFSRLGIRATESMPEELKNQSGKGIFNALWAEAHPMYKAITNFWQNEPLTYGAEPPRGLDGSEWVGGVTKMFTSAFRIYGAMAEMEKLGQLPEGTADTSLEDNLDIFEKAASHFGFQYITSTEDQRRIGETFKLLENAKEMGRRMGYSTTLTEDEKAERILKFQGMLKSSLVD
jgi:hypothetical protein